MSRVGGSPSNPLPFFVNVLTSLALDNIYIHVHAVQPLVFISKLSCSSPARTETVKRKGSKEVSPFLAGVIDYGRPQC